MTTPMGTCCECPTPQTAGSLTCISCGLPPCHTTQPTATQPTATQPTVNMFQYRADPNEKKLDFTAPPTYQQGGSSLTIHMEKELDFTAPPTITRDALNNYIEQTAERNDKILERYLNGAPTPNTGTEEEIKKIGKQVEAEYQLGGLSDGLYMDFAMEVTKHALATQKSQLIAEVEKLIEEEAAEWSADKQGAISALRHLREKVRSLLD